MSRNIIETVMGAIVLVVAIIFLVFAYSSAQVQSVRGYEITAKFTSADGTRPGSDVRISGIKVGSIIAQTLDQASYRAVLTLSIDPTVKLPTDTTAAITSSGLLGDKYVALNPGAADDMMKPGGTIQITQSSPNLESLIGNYIFSSSQGGQGQGGQGGGQAPAKPAPSDLVPKLDDAAPAKP